VERVLRSVYEMDAAAHDPEVGDNSTLFGQKIWHHGWYALEHEFATWDGVQFSYSKGSYRLHVGPLNIAVYKAGHAETDSIYDVRFDGSATKRSGAERNEGQLQLFAVDELIQVEEPRSFDLNELWIVHFGSPREALVKLFIGAPRITELDKSEWAWFRRIDDGPGEAQLPKPTELVPFDQLPEPEVSLELEADEEADETGTGD
jgi:hypothetical protein